jgi:hypothetical protein
VDGLLLWLGLVACQDWRDRVSPEVVARDPEQVLLEGVEPTIWTEGGHVIALSPRAQYRVTGYVVEISRQLLDEWDFVVPLDVALVWGPAADPEVLKGVQFHLTSRYLSFRTKRGELIGRLRGHVSNNHLIPKSPEIADVLDDLEIGDLVTLEGQLVDLEIKSPKGHLRHRNKSSLSRDDDGSGACEQLWVEQVTIGPGG